MKAKRILGTFFLFISLLILVTCVWAKYTFLVESFSQVIFLLQVPSQPGDFGMIIEWGIKCFIPSLIITAVCVGLLFNINRLIKNKKNIIIQLAEFLKKIYLMFATSCLIFSIGFVIFYYDVYGYLTSQVQKTALYEEYYVDPSTTNIVFPNKKRNIIHIYLESIESSFVSQQSGGISEKSYIPELENLALNHLNFSNTDKIGGSQTIIGTQWTIGSMVAQDAGIPLTLPIEGNSYTSTSAFLPGAYTIGEVLEKENYQQVFLSGSKASFGGTVNFYRHGNYIVKDYDYMIKNKFLPEDYYKFWGYEDSKLFEFAKKELIELSLSNQPFNLEMITMDAHMPYGYICDQCPNISDDQYENVLACQSKQVNDFIEWCKTQDFYENTTIVITGDHNSMAQKFFDNLDNTYLRTPYNVIINSAVETSNTFNRQFSAMDFYPTILASMGVKIEGERLGLGTNLFSSTPTLLEEIGWGLNNEVQKTSDFYNKEIIGIK